MLRISARLTFHGVKLPFGETGVTANYNLFIFGIVIKTVYIKLVAILVFILMVFSVPAQHPYFWQLTEEDGLPSNTVYDLMEDTHGNIWMGTDKGLVKFNGQQFEYYVCESRKSLAVTNVNQDEQGRIWCSNFSYQVFYVENGEMKELPLGLDNNNIEGHLKLTLTEEHLYVYTFNFANRYELATGNWELDYASSFWPKSHSHDGRSSLQDITYHNNEFYYHFRYEVLRVNDGKVINRQPQAKGSVFFISSWAENELVMLERRTPTALLLSENLEVNGEIDLGTHFKDSSTRSLSYSSLENRFWFCTSKGAAYLKNGKLSQVFLPGEQVSDVLEDREGNLWFATLQNALYVVPEVDIEVYNTKNSGLVNDHLRSLGVSPEGDLLIGTYHGEVQIMDQFKTPGKYLESGIKKEIEGFAQSPSGETVVFGERVFNIDTPNKDYAQKWQYFKSLEWIDDETSICVESGQFFVEGLEGGRPVFPNQKKYGFLWGHHLETFYRLTLKTKGVRSAAYDKDSNAFYVGTTSGLFYYSESYCGEVFLDGQESISCLRVINGNDGVFWVATASQGILGFEERNLIHEIGTKTGLATDYFSRVRSDGDLLWAASNMGLYRISKSTEEFELFNRLDGLPSNECSDILIHGDYVWLATMKGLVKIPRDLSSVNKTLPKLLFSGVYVNQQKTDLKEKWSHDLNNFKFDLSPLAFRNRGEGKVKYRLIGRDDNWTEVSITESVVRFHSLPPGNYTFEAYATNEDGLAGETIRYSFTVLPPFWQTWWFVLIMILFLVLVVSLIFVVRINILKKRNRIEQDLRVSQLTALKAQMNPHFVFNALNSIQEYVLLHQTKLANDYLGKFARLMRKTLDLSNQMEISLAEEISLLDLYLELEAIRFEDSFSYLVEVDEQLDTEYIMIPSMIIQPYVENAIKHGLLHKKEGRELKLSFKAVEGAVECHVIDNGIGIKASMAINARRKQTHKSFSTSAIQKRLELLNKDWPNKIEVKTIDLTDEITQATGTHVKLIIPIKPETNA